MVRREQVLAPVLGPLDRLAELARGERDEKVLWIELASHAEAAADVRLDHVDAFFREVHVLRQHAPRGVGHLGRSGHGELGPCAIPLREQATGLHAYRGMPLNREFFLPRVEAIPCGGRYIALG